MARTPTAVSVLLTAGILAATLVAAPRGGSQPESQPRVVTPGDCDTSKPCPPPSDAIVLFDGTSLEGWTTPDGKGPAPWTVENGVATVNGKGSIISKHKFNDAQIHIEFATPAEVSGDSQGRGNSGVYIQGRYELQILDSFNNPTNPKGSCGAIYSKHAPLVNASRGPGQWQTYDIVFHAAKFDESGKKIANARLTAFHNGVLIQDNIEIDGTTGAAPMKESAEPGFLYLQDHGNPVKFRNIWIRPL